jgi:hypothetical protein
MPWYALPAFLSLLLCNASMHALLCWTEGPNSFFALSALLFLPCSAVPILSFFSFPVMLFLPCSPCPVIPALISKALVLLPLFPPFYLSLPQPTGLALPVFSRYHPCCCCAPRSSPTHYFSASLLDGSTRSRAPTLASQNLCSLAPLPCIPHFLTSSHPPLIPHLLFTYPHA